MAIINNTGPFVLGTSGDDTIDVRNGPTLSEIFGLGGNDIYYIDAMFNHFGGNADLPEDIIHEDANGGTDTVNVHLYQFNYNGNYFGGSFYTLTDNVENLNATANTDGSNLNFDLNGNSLANVITGTAFDNNSHFVINGYGGNDKLTGGVNSDTLNGGVGNDTMAGGDGDDRYYVDSTTDVIVETATGSSGNDSVYSSTTFTLGTNVENLSLSDLANINGTGNALSNSLFGNYGNNKLTGLDGNDYINGIDGNDTLLGGNGDDTLLGDIGLDSLDGGAGNDYMLGGVGNDISIGGTGNDYLSGGDGNDMVQGGDGNDYLSGDNGNDTLMGGAGNDTMYGGSDSGVNKLDGGAGDDSYWYVKATDTVADTGVGGNDTIYAHEQLAGDLAAGIENLTLDGSIVTGRGNALNNYINGNSAGNILFGLAGNDYLAGNDGNDILDGGDGNDILDGGTGNDLMKGGNGNDIYIMDSTSDVVIETAAAAAGGGIDTIYTSAIIYNGTLNAFIENVTMTGNSYTWVYGNTLNNVIVTNNVGGWADGKDGNDSMVGGSGQDILYGGNGLDTLNGGLGDDNLSGGDGSDLYIVDSNNDAVFEYGVAGIDTVQSSASFFDLSTTAGRAGIENLKLSGTSSINGSGNSLANTITGNDGDNSLNGNSGNDTLIGGLGSDILDGGLGNDNMSGGLGDDLYYVDSATDKVIELAAQGNNDTINSSITFSLAALSNVENLTLTGGVALNATGNTGNNSISGNTINNTLDGGLGNDTLNGNDGDDSLIGGAGNDALIGGNGNDTMVGGAGNDVYYYENGSFNYTDTITELAGGGTDTIRKYNFSATTIDLTTPTLLNIENVELTSSADTLVTGNALDNNLTGGTGADTLKGGIGNDTLLGASGIDSLIGGVGNDVLDGGNGADTLEGGAGNDVYFYDGTDTITEFSAEGTDTVNVSSNTTYFAGANIENVNLNGSYNNNVFGNGLNNILTGSDGDNYLNGASGNDTLIGGLGNDVMYGGVGLDSMTGGAGNDTYVVDNIGDKVVELLNGGTETVYSSVTFSLATSGANIENLYLFSGNINGTGNALNNNISGNSGNNKLDGDAGNDTLIGGAGNDTLIGGTGNDILIGGYDTDSLTGGAGNDTFIFNNVGAETVTDYLAGTDRLALDVGSLTFNGAGGTLNSSQFTLGTVALGASATNTITYDQATGSLYYDADAGDVGVAELIADFKDGTVLSALDFYAS